MRCCNMKKIGRIKLHLIIITIVLVMIPFISIGFSALSTVLNIRGDFLITISGDPVMGNYYNTLNKTYMKKVTTKKWPLL